MSEELIDIGQNTDEEDKYIKMKDFYKQGKKDCKDLYLAGAGVTAHEMAQEYTHHEEYIQQYLAGWNYMLHLIDIGEEQMTMPVFWVYSPSANKWKRGNAKYVPTRI